MLPEEPGVKAGGAFWILDCRMPIAHCREVRSRLQSELLVNGHGRDRVALQSFPKLSLDFTEDRLILLQEGARIVAALAQTGFAVVVIGPGASDDILGSRQIEHVARLADSLAVDHVEFGGAEGRS